MKKILSILFAVVCMYMMAACTAEAPTSVTETYLNDLMNGKYQELVDNLHFKNEMSTEDKQNLVLMLESKAEKTVEKNGAIQGYEIVSEEISEDGESAVVKYNLKYAEKTEANQKVNLVKVDGKWMVSSGK